MTDLAEAILRANEAEDAKRAPPCFVPQIDADRIAMLRGIARRYAEGCPFRPGDLVTPRAESGLVGAGQPFVVLTVPQEPVSIFIAKEPSDTLTGYFGRRLDMRVCALFAVQSGGYVALPFWAESWLYEPFVASTEGARA